jgi:hypothetical protein
MGHDTNVFVLYGYKFKLSQVFESDWLDSSIMEDDDWQLVNMGEDNNSFFKKYVTNSILMEYLNNGWELYILSSLQEDCKSDESYMFLYSYMQELSCDNEFETGEINMCPVDLGSVNKLGVDSSEFKLHWVIQNSW